MVKRFFCLFCCVVLGVVVYLVSKGVQPPASEILIELYDNGEIQLIPISNNPPAPIPVPAPIKLPQSTKGERRQSIRLYNSAKNRIENIDLTEYLIGVLAGEMPASYELEALKAQAVAARTYLEYKIAYGGCNTGGDICSASNHCQAYKDKAQQQKTWGKDYDRYYAKLKEAVNSTAGEIMFYNGKIISALYHSSSAGSTEACVAVYGNNLSYLVSVESYEDADDITVQQKFSRKEFANTINKEVKGADLKASSLNKQVSIKSRTDSGRVDTVQVGSKEITSIALRKLFGLRSTNFTISFDSDSIIFTVKGHGHGLGMSQSGANALAKQGKDYITILKHYYQGVIIE